MAQHRPTNGRQLSAGAGVVNGIVSTVAQNPVTNMALKHMSSSTAKQRTRSAQQARDMRAVEPGWLMPLVDIVLVIGAFWLAYFVRYDLQILRPIQEVNSSSFNPYVPYLFIYTGWLLVNYRGSGLYRHARGRAWIDEVMKIVNGATNATMLIMAISFVLQPLVFSRLMLVYAAAFTVILLAVARLLQRIVWSHLRSKGIGVQRVLIVGAGDVGQAVLRALLARKELGYVPVGYVDDDFGKVDLGRVRGLGNLDKMKAVIKAQDVHLVVITLDWEQHERIIKLVRAARSAGAAVRVVPDVFQLNMRQVQIENLDGIPLLGVDGDITFKGVNRVMKRALDLFVITLAAPFWVPVFGLVALAIRLEGNGPVFYRQRRVGFDGQDFDMVKFRSMIPDADKMQRELVQTLELDPRHPKIPDDPRMTRVGRFIRRTSLDELPNLLNVLRGQMSLVGPRPPTPDEVELYEPWHRQRLQITPGITGLWQVSGRSEIPFDEMCLLDIYYIENWSIAMDARILLMTVPRVLLRRGAY